MKYTHVYRPGTDPGLTVLEINDSNNTPYVPGSAETTAAGALSSQTTTARGLSVVAVTAAGLPI
jgi:hypothetical protein